MEKNYVLHILFAKSKPIVVIKFDEPTKLVNDRKWGKKFKEIDTKTYHISTVIIEKVFEVNEQYLGKWAEAKVSKDSIDKYYGFFKDKDAEIHSLTLSKRFINDWNNSYSKLMRYTINRENDGSPPIVKECLYDAGIYSSGEIGDITAEEFDCLRKTINPDGDIIIKIKNSIENSKK